MKKYATNAAIAETESDTTRSVQPLKITSSQYDEELVTETLWGGDVFEEYALNKIFFEGLDVLFHRSMREYWKYRKDSNMHDLAFYEIALLLLQRYNGTSKWTSPTGLRPQDKRWKL